MQHRLLVLTLLVYCSFVVFTQTNPNSLPTRKAIIGWGQNNNGKLDNTRGILTMPTIIDNGGAYNLDDVVSVANGEYHMLVLLSNGDIFGRGGNSYGQLGNSSSYQQNAYNVKVNSTAFTVTGVTITDIAVCSYQSFAFAAAQNKLFEWGYKITGDVLSPQLIIFTPSQALYQKTIAKMFAGYFHAFVIDTDGKLYGRGAGYMDLLYPNAPGRQDDFVSVQPTLPPLKQVAVGMKHILVLGVNGKVYAWGLNDNGQIAVSLFLISHTQ
jgi:alpha-tubulin suppressor-like RCC1 family protein